MVRLLQALQVAGMACGLSACSAPSSGGGAPDLPPVIGLAASLEDERRPLDGGRLRWSTYWRLTWTPYAEAKEYEVQTVTSEGRSPKLRTLAIPEYRLQVAAGENPAAMGLQGRNVQLEMQGAQLAFRVRAILADGRRSAWSEAAAAGRALQ